MIRQGSTMTKVERVVYLPNDEEEYKVLELNVDWNYESSEYGDGSEDIEFTTYATDSEGNEVELSSDEETKLMEELRDSGEFA